MPRTKASQKRIGKNEQKLLTKMSGVIRGYKLFKANKNKGETRLNELLIDHLRQHGVDVKNTSIPSPQFLEETFRPECYLPGTAAFSLCCVECKKLTDKTIKARWKEGLSQCLLYTSRYKYVFYVLYDFTKSGLAARAFGRGRKTETTLARKLREKLQINIVVLKAQ